MIDPKCADPEREARQRSRRAMRRAWDLIGRLRLRREASRLLEREWQTQSQEQPE